MRMLLVIVHPGWLLDAYTAWYSQEPSRVTLAPEELRAAVADEIRSWEGDRVLLAGNSMHAIDHETGGPLEAAVIEVWERDSVIITRTSKSDLRDATTILINRFQADLRPRILVTGGGADAERDCVGIVSRNLREFGCKTVAVSPLAPTES